MITYKIPCSCGCGVQVERNVFATPACNVRAFRDGKAETVTVESGVFDERKPYKRTERNHYKELDERIPYKDVIKTPKEAVKKMKEKKPDSNFCEHGSMKGLCKYGC